MRPPYHAASEAATGPNSLDISFICYLFYSIPAGSYTNIESRDSPVGGSCNYVDETAASAASEPKLIYKKSVFKKKSTSSTATVIFGFTRRRTTPR